VLNRLFGVTLWCKTLVLRKDKVTQCVTKHGTADSILYRGKPTYDTIRYKSLTWTQTGNQNNYLDLEVIIATVTTDVLDAGL